LFASDYHAPHAAVSQACLRRLSCKYRMARPDGRCKLRLRPPNPQSRLSIGAVVPLETRVRRSFLYLDCLRLHGVFLLQLLDADSAPVAQAAARLEHTFPKARVAQQQLLPPGFWILKKDGSNYLLPLRSAGM